MMLDTSAYFGQQQQIPPQLLLHALLAQGLIGHHPQMPWGPQQQLGGFGPQSLFGHQASPYGQQQPIWPSPGFAPQSPFAHLTGQYGQQPGIWPPFGLGQPGGFPLQFGIGQGQFGGLPQQLGFGQGQLGGIPPQLAFGLGQPGGFPFGGFGQQHPLSGLGRAIFPGVPQFAYAGC